MNERSATLMPNKPMQRIGLRPTADRPNRYSFISCGFNETRFEQINGNNISQLIPALGDRPTQLLLPSRLHIRNPFNLRPLTGRMHQSLHNNRWLDN